MTHIAVAQTCLIVQISAMVYICTYINIYNMYVNTHIDNTHSCCTDVLDRADICCHGCGPLAVWGRCANIYIHIFPATRCNPRCVLHIFDVMHPHVWHDSCMCMIRYRSVYHITYSCMCDMTHLYMCDMTHLYMCDMTHTCVWNDVSKCVSHDSFVHVKYLLICTCEIPHQCIMCHDASICVT